MMTLGSLFDGAGTFPFAAQICGIEALWASEIEPFPVAVTTKRFPNMKHLGDITKINGAEIDPVDIITFGSPCQDLSVAGKRAGLDGERSGLFMEAVRIIKEMRKKTNGRYPTFAIWENVPGAFSSHEGEDFRIVLEELVKVKDGDAVVPRPPIRGGRPRWNDAGLILGDGYSVGYRVLDAQFWGVPQRRRRIFLVADFRGQRAGKILFERDGLSRSFAESRESWQGITKSLAFCPDAAGRNTYCLQANCIDRADTAGCNGRGWGENVSYTLDTIDRHAVVYHQEYGISSYNSNAMKSSNPNSGIYKADTARTLDLNGGNPSCNQGGVVLVQVIENNPNDSRVGVSEDGNVQTMTSRMGTGGGNVPMVRVCSAMRYRNGSKSGGIGYEEECAPTLSCDLNAAVLCIRERCGCEGGGERTLDTER